MQDSITLLDITQDGTIVAGGYLRGRKRTWTIKQDELLFILELINSRAKDTYSLTKPRSHQPKGLSKQTFSMAQRNALETA